MNAPHEANAPDPETARSAEDVAHLLAVVAEGDLTSAMGCLEAAIDELKSKSDAAARSKEILSRTPAPLLREGIRLRAARQGRSR